MNRDMECSIAGCEKHVKSNGLCGMHDARKRKTGTTDPRKAPGTCRNGLHMMTDDNIRVDPRGIRRCRQCEAIRRRLGMEARTDLFTPEIAARFESMYAVNEATGCWEWTASKVFGYGQFFPTWRARWQAHRYSYSLHAGPLDDTLHIHHKCHNRACVNPDHLLAVTPSEHHSTIHPTPKRSHCLHGHPLVGENVSIWVRSDGRVMRRCATCVKQKGRDRYWSDVELAAKKSREYRARNRDHLHAYDRARWTGERRERSNRQRSEKYRQKKAAARLAQVAS